MKKIVIFFASFMFYANFDAVPETAIQRVDDLRPFHKKMVVFNAAMHTGCAFPATTEELSAGTTRYGYVTVQEKDKEIIATLSPLLQSKRGYFFTIENSSLKGQSLSMREVSPIEINAINAITAAHNASFTFGKHDQLNVILTLNKEKSAADAKSDISTTQQEAAVIIP